MSEHANTLLKNLLISTESVPPDCYYVFLPTLDIYEDGFFISFNFYFPIISYYW